ncbi:hypothetical protein Aperf_G00000058367 [Anoplocephala perfoliata]
MKVDNLQRALEIAEKENAELKRDGREDGQGAATIIEALRKENRLARKRVTELEAEFRTMKDSRNSSNHMMIPEDIAKQFQEWKMRLGLMLSADTADLFNSLNDRLDRALMYDTRSNEADFTQQELKNQLREAHNSANELANRVEVLLAEKETLKRDANLWKEEKTNLLATRGLLEQRVISLERQLEELRGKLSAETDEARVAKREFQELLLEKNSQTVQFNAFMESLAATLTTLDSPCAATEVAIKETVSKMMAELQTLKKAGVDLEKKVEQLVRQTEFQLTNGQSLCEELDSMKRELEDERKVKERIQCELEGYRLISSQKRYTSEHQDLGKIVDLCDKLSIPVKKHSYSNLVDQITEKVLALIDQGCIPPECIQDSVSPKIKSAGENTKHKHIHERTFRKNDLDDCPSCSHLNTTPLDLASRAPDWTDLEEKRIQFFCSTCLVCLALALKQRVRAVLSSDLLNDKREKSLLEELDKSKREIDELHEKIMKIEHEKSEEYEKLEQMVSKLEALRQHQAKRIAGLQSKTQRQSTIESQKAQELHAAKNFLIENRQKQLKLLNFRNSLGKLLGIDAWLYPNSEGLIVQRIQQILLNFSTQGRSLFPQQIFTPISTIQPSFSVSQLPALTYSKDEFPEQNLRVFEQSAANSSHADFSKNTAGTTQLKPKTATRRSLSASGKNVRKY